MKILVMGAGALGGYFGARLRAVGEDVTFVARGAHLEAMRKYGLAVEDGVAGGRCRLHDGPFNRMVQLTG